MVDRARAGRLISQVSLVGVEDFTADDEFWRLVEEGYVTAGVAQEKLGF